MFWAVLLSIIRSFSLYTQQWYMSYSFADSLWAGSWSFSQAVSKPVWHIPLLCVEPMGSQPDNGKVELDGKPRARTFESPSAVWMAGSRNAGLLWWWYVQTCHTTGTKYNTVVPIYILKYILRNQTYNNQTRIKTTCTKPNDPSIYSWSILHWTVFLSLS